MDEQTLGVRELLTSLRDLLDEAVPGHLWVQGEIRGLTRSRPGHVYFDLVEPGDDERRPEARLPAALFASDRARLERQLSEAGAAPLSDGLYVRVLGKVGLYVARSQVQLVVRGIDPDFTLGRLEQARRALLAALAAEGLLERNAALDLPRLPRNIALVTSAASAACADALHELEASSLGWDVQLVDTLVQGEGAPAAIARAIATAVAAEAEVVLLVRGGGSRSDLAAFDSEIVARTIAVCPIPVWTGIGHEIDRSVADEVAHRAHKTPTACIAALAAYVRDDLDRAAELWQAIDAHRRGRIDRERSRLDRSAHKVERAVLARLRQEETRLAATSHLARARVQARLDRNRARLDLAGERLATRDPARLLERGWSLTLAADGTPLRSVHEIEMGAVLTTRLADGSINSTVTHTTNRTGAEDDRA